MRDRLWRFGTSSWSERSWVGPFYEPGTKPKDFLSAYARRYGAVEADTTYYRAPSESMVRGWRARTPEGFRMAAKFPRAVVHAGDGPRPDADRALRLEAVGDKVEYFLSVMRGLGDRCGPLLIQLPYFNRTHFAEEEPFLRRLDDFLGGLPDEFQYAVEVRNKAWYSESLTSLLSSHGAALCLSDHKYLPHPSVVMERLDVATADFSYVRLIGDREAVDRLADGFGREVLDQGDRLRLLARSLLELSADVREVWAFANNHYAGHGPASIDRLATEVTGEAPTRPMSDDGSLPF